MTENSWQEKIGSEPLDKAHRLGFGPAPSGPIDVWPQDVEFSRDRYGASTCVNTRCPFHSGFALGGVRQKEESLHLHQ
jgi:hypothetical protein